MIVTQIVPIIKAIVVFAANKASRFLSLISKTNMKIPARRENPYNSTSSLRIMLVVLHGV